MMQLPRFALPAGTEVTLMSTRMEISGTDKNGYTVVDLDTGSMRMIPFQSFVEHLKLPGARINTLAPKTGNRLQHRMGGFNSARALPKNQQEVGRFHIAICKAMEMLQAQVREETGDEEAKLTIRLVEKRREFVRNITQTLFGVRVHLTAPRGGNTRAWVLYHGRTLMRHFKAYSDLHPDESVLDALVPLDHLKGNCTSRIPLRLKDLMTLAWEEVGLDAKKPDIANVWRHLEMLVHEENKKRRDNELSPLIVPSQVTLRAHKRSLLSETGYLIATKGERHARNKRGRGSTDIRALVVGEYVEIDECKASLVASAKARGVWQGLKDDARTTLHEIDEIVRERFHILVMLDVASRMPLAWVISDQPRADATLALFRMATREKAREARIYGCEGQAVGAVGLGHVRNDNGPGLRNSATVSSLMGISATNTVTRAYAATDKPYIERMFGTNESVLLKLIHGYTGRKPGELPGYDATENGVLDIEEIYGILTRFMIDEYPAMRHTGTGMGARRPIEVYKEINETRGCFHPLDPDLRRIHLGWEQHVTPTDEGVRVFGGIWFNSDELQSERENVRRSGRASVFVDPDSMDHATVLLPGLKAPITVQLQFTAFADMTLPEILELMASWRKEDPSATAIYDDRLARLRRKRFDQLRVLGVERKLKRSYSTIEECQRKAQHLFAGARVIRAHPMASVTRPGRLTDLRSAPEVFQISSDDTLINGHAEEVPFGDPDRTDSADEAVPALEDNEPPPAEQGPGAPQKALPPDIAKRTKSPALGRPKNVKGLE